MNSAKNGQFASEHPTLSSSLLDGAKKMDPASWTRLVHTFGPVVYGWSRVSGVSESDSSDIVQEVFVSVARGIAAFERQKKEGSFRSWLATITRNRIRDYFRRSSHREAATGGTDAWNLIQSIPVDDLDSTICPQSINDTVHRLALDAVQAEFEPKTWQAFCLTTLEDKSASDVAQQLGISTASVYQAKSRVLRRLRKHLSELPE